MAYDIQNDKNVAIKRFNNYMQEDSEDSVPCTALREISFLVDFCHPNIVKVIDVFPDKNNLFLVLELIETDLQNFLDNLPKNYFLPE